MSPLLGSYGGSSEYAYRGTIDDWPDDFSFVDQFDVAPGGTYTSNSQTITGINNRAIVRVSAGASVAINGGPYVIPTDASPVFIRNNQTITVRVPTTSGTVADYNKTYSTVVSIGKKRTTWSIRTDLIDDTPVSFTFTNLTGREVGTAYTSNEIVVSGLENGFSFPASIISGQGSVIVNGGTPASSANVVNGDRLYLRLISPLEYSNYPTGSGTKTSTTGLQLGNYSTTWSVSNRDPDLFVDPFDFPDVNNAALTSVYTARSTNPPTGSTTTITGADVGLPLITAVSGCELRVEQPGVQTTITGTTINITSGQSYTVGATSYPVRGVLYVPTSLTSSSIDVIVAYHGTISSQTQTIMQAAQFVSNIFLNNLNIKDKIIFSVAYPQDAIPAANQFGIGGNEDPNFIFESNLPYARAALLWAKNSLNTFMSANSISKTISKVFMFGHSQGGSLVHKLNTLETTDGAICNAPGPIRLDLTCTAIGSSGDLIYNTTCLKLFNKYGSPSTSTQYFNRSVAAYTTGLKARTLYIQGLQDTAGNGNQLTWMNQLIQTLTTNSASNAEFSYLRIPGGHEAFVSDSQAQNAIRLFVGPTADSGTWSIRRDFSTANTVVYNGDRLTARVSSGSTYSQTRIGIVTVSNHTAQFIVTTRPRPVDTIPDSFSNQFTDLTNQNRNVVIESNEITLSGITTYGDQGVASITTGTNGGGAEFKVTRGTNIVRAYGITTSYVQQGDKIRLRITSSPDSNITRTATFRVDGIDTNTVITGQSGFQDDIWSVNTATRQCGLTDFTLPAKVDVNPNTLQSVSFVAGGFDSDCRMVVSTSNTNSYLSVPGSTATNNVAVSPGTTVTVYMTSGDYFATRSTNVTVSNTSNSVVPANSITRTWTVDTVDDTRNTTVTLSSNRTSIQLGQTVTLSWTSVNASSVTGYSGDGFIPTTVNSTGVTVTPTTVGTVRYSITVFGPPSAGNYATQTAANPQGVTSFVDVTVTEDTTPDSFTMNPSTRTGQTRSSYSTFTAQSTVKTSVSVTGLSAPTTITASCSSSTGNDVYFTLNGTGRNTSASVKNDDVLVLYLQNSSAYSTQARASLTIGSNTQSVTSTSEACVVTTGVESIATNVSVTTKAAVGTYQNGSPFSYQAYTGKTGPALSSKCKSDLVIDSKNPFTSPGSITVPTGATSAYIACIGGGGGGGGDPGSGNDFAGGGGGGAASYANIPVSAGSQFTFSVGAGGDGATDGRASRGENSVIRYNGVEQIKAGGGQGGETSQGGDGAIEGQFNGASGQSDQGSSGGKGGGAGVLGGGTAPPGSNASGCPGGASGGGGGGGSGTGQVPGGTTPGPDATCDNNGRPGANYGGGGGGGARGARGGKGAPGQVRINFSGTVAAPTWNSLIDTIVNAYRNNAFRPPSGAEIRSWASNFNSNPATTLPELDASIRGAFSPSSRANTLTDFCGGAF